MWTRLNRLRLVSFLITQFSLSSCYILSSVCLPLPNLSEVTLSQNYVHGEAKITGKLMSQSHVGSILILLTLQFGNKC